MSEEELGQDEENTVAGSDVEDAGAEQEIVDFEQNGLLLKIATNGNMEKIPSNSNTPKKKIITKSSSDFFFSFLLSKLKTSLIRRK